MYCTDSDSGMNKKIIRLFWNKSILFLLLFLVTTLVLLFQTQSYNLKPKKSIPPIIKERLKSLGEKALLSYDFPISAIVLYNDSIVGEGFNTVFKDSIISGHAEILALNEVYKSYGWDKFRKLDRDKLTLYSTYEPCEMCKGTIIHYKIKNIYFEHNKSSLWRMKGTLKNLFYNFSLKRLDAPGLQESLFHRREDLLKNLNK